MLLENSVFTQEPGLISDKGIIIKCFRLFLDAKKQGRDIISPFAKYMAYVDVFTGLATWLRETDDRCSAQFILDANHPTIQGTDIWNLACGTAVYNDVLLGGDTTTSRDAIYNGDNIIESTTTEPTPQEIEEESSEIKESKTEPKEPIKPIKPIELEESKEPIELEESNEPIKPIELEESNEPIKPIDPIDPIDPIEPIDPIDPIDPIEPKDSSKPEEFQNKKQDSNKNKNKSSHKSNTPLNNIIITGPNGSGKSTYIKSITECVILAQTVGIVPAREFRLTPFAHISTYLNIPDCQGKESLFQAEMNRCYQQLETLQAAEEAGEFSFNIMDEIFVSTNYQEGMSGAYAVINQLCRFNKCLNVITTHFDKLANLEDLNVGRKYFDVEIGEDGRVARDYKIRNGVSSKHMALRLLRNRGFSDEIVKDAEAFYEKICK